MDPTEATPLKANTRTDRIQLNVVLLGIFKSTFHVYLNRFISLAHVWSIRRRLYQRNVHYRGLLDFLSVGFYFIVVVVRSIPRFPCYRWGVRQQHSLTWNDSLANNFTASSVSHSGITIGDSVTEECNRTQRQQTFNTRNSSKILEIRK